MEAWVAMVIGVVGLAIVLAIPVAVWAIFVYGLVQMLREKQGKDGPGQPISAQ